MANYKPTAKGIIDRNALMSSNSRIDVPQVVCAEIAVFTCTMFCFFTLLIFSKTAAYISLVLGLAACVWLLIHYVTPIISKKKDPPVYYLECDTVSSTDMLIQVKEEFTRRSIYSKHHHRQEVTYYSYLVVFKSGRRFNLKYKSTSDIVNNKYSKIKNIENIPNHMTILKTLSEGDECFILFAEGDDTIIDVFDTSFYSLSPAGFTERDGKYYLK